MRCRRRAYRDQGPWKVDWRLEVKFDLFKYANVWGVGGKYRGDKGFS